MGYPLLGHDALSSLYIIAFDLLKFQNFVWNFISVFVKSAIEHPCLVLSSEWHGWPCRMSWELFFWELIF